MGGSQLNGVRMIVRHPYGLFSIRYTFYPLGNLPISPHNLRVVFQSPPSPRIASANRSRAVSGNSALCQRKDLVRSILEDLRNVRREGAV